MHGRASCGPHKARHGARDMNWDVFDFARRGMPPAGNVVTLTPMTLTASLGDPLLVIC